MVKKVVVNPGHKGHYRELLPSDQVDFIQTCDRRQICWAHSKRDFTKLSEKDDKTHIPRSENELLIIWAIELTQTDKKFSKIK